MSEKYKYNIRKVNMTSYIIFLLRVKGKNAYDFRIPSNIFTDEPGFNNYKQAKTFLEDFLYE